MADLQSPRLTKLDEKSLNPDQRSLAQSIASGPRGQFKMSGPFAIYLHAPTFGELAQKLGGHLRFKTGVSPRPILMLMTVACAASFLTPIATPANMMVMGPGGYRFGDYWKLGLPVMGWFLIVSLTVIPLAWPL